MSSDVVQRAQGFAERAYEERGDFVGLRHSRDVGELLAELGCEPHIVAVGHLHDLIEDAGVTRAELAEEFGERIAELVGVLTEDERIADLRERKAELRARIARSGHAALVIFAADKLARVRHADEHGEQIELEKLQHYRRSSELFAIHGVRTPHTVELARRLALRRDDQRALTALPT